MKIREVTKGIETRCLRRYHQKVASSISINKMMYGEPYTVYFIALENGKEVIFNQCIADKRRYSFID